MGRMAAPLGALRELPRRRSALWGALAALLCPLHARAALLDPLLGPEGWTWLGPWPPAGPGARPGPGRGEGADAREAVWFDVDTCGAVLTRVDLDGGPGSPDVRLARVWVQEAGAWRWLDDWRVQDGVLRRPGRADLRLGADATVDGERVVWDSAGRVVERTRGDLRLEVLRREDSPDPTDGGFAGLRRGGVSVELTGLGSELRGVATDGRTVQYRRQGWSSPNHRR